MILRVMLTCAAFGALTMLALPGAASANSYGSGAPNSDQARVSERISVFELPRDRPNEIIGMLQADEIVTIQRCTPGGNWCRVFSDQPTGWVPASYLIGSPAKADATPLQSLTAVPPSVASAPRHPQHQSGFF